MAIANPALLLRCRTAANQVLKIALVDHIRSRGLMVKALVFGTRDWEFESSRDRFISFSLYWFPVYATDTEAPPSLLFG